MKRKNKPITFGAPDVGYDEINAIKKVILSKWIGTGPVARQFEKKFKSYKQANYALAVNSCTSAIHISLLALGIGHGDEVLVTSMTFSSTINAIIHSGAKPILIDINSETFNIDSKLLEKKISKKTKGILAVHLAGLPCDMTEILKIKNKYKLFLIEDCAHAVESKYKGKHTGTFGDAGCFSFYSTKNLTTGEGGMILFKKKKLFEKAKIISLHGLSKDAWKRSKKSKVVSKNFHYDVKEIGFKYNLTDINASIGLVQLEKLERNHKKRQILFNEYQKNLMEMPIFTQLFNKNTVRHGCHLFILALDKSKTQKSRDNLFTYLSSNKIGCGINYRSVTDMSVFKKKFGWNNKTCIKSKYLGDNTISLPLHPNMTKSHVKYICKLVRKFFS